MGKITATQMVAIVRSRINTKNSARPLQETFIRMSADVTGAYSMVIAYNGASLPGDEGIVAFGYAAEKIARDAGIDLLNPNVRHVPFAVTYSW
jgi:hypothetical protein